MSAARAGDLAALEPGCFSLDGRPPTVTVDAADTKGKRTEPIPLPAHLVEALRPWLAGRAGRLWPGRWAEQRHQVDWLRADLERAGIVAGDAQGRRVTFHSLKRRYVVSVIKAGADVHEVRRLARHRDVKTTLDYYADADLPDLGRIADRLPPPPTG